MSMADKTSSVWQRMRARTGRKVGRIQNSTSPTQLHMWNATIGTENQARAIANILIHHLRQIFGCDEERDSRGSDVGKRVTELVIGKG